MQSVGSGKADNASVVCVKCPRQLRSVVCIYRFPEAVRFLLNSYIKSLLGFDVLLIQLVPGWEGYSGSATDDSGPDRRLTTKCLNIP